MTAFLALSLIGDAYSRDRIGQATGISGQRQNRVDITIKDQSVSHVHPAGVSFAIDVRIDYAGPAAISYHWEDFRGRPISGSTELSVGRFIRIISPLSTPGYYGLAFTANDRSVLLPSRQPGEKRVYGFVTVQMPARDSRLSEPESPFGIVHASLRDPYLPSWIKTLTWKTYPAKYWPQQIEKRRQLGFLELPIVVGLDWKTDDSEPVSTEQLTALAARIKQYFRADPLVRYWELGLEENLSATYEKRYYWDNLNSKVKAVRRVANEINTDIKLLYQIAELQIKPIAKFLQSEAAKSFDILTLHPYAWPDFIDPVVWLPGYLEKVRRLMRDNRLSTMPIWFTEVGVPHHGNHPDAFFGYPATGDKVSGKSPDQAISYMIKLHVLSLQLRVGKLFWYNYQDDRPGRESVENHFGLIDYWGYPKPIYIAYINLYRHLESKRPTPITGFAKGLQMFKFEGKTNNLWVLWMKSPGKKQIQKSSLSRLLGGEEIIDSMDMLGTSLPRNDDIIPISGDPVYLKTRASGAERRCTIVK